MTFQIYNAGNAAYGAAMGFGSGARAALSNIDFGDIKTDLMKKTLSEQPMKQYEQEMLFAQSALNNFRSVLNARERLKYNRETRELQLEENKKTRAFNLLASMGNSNDVSSLLGLGGVEEKQSDPRQDLQNELTYRVNRRRLGDELYGAGNPVTAAQEAINRLNQGMPAIKSNATQLPAQPEIKPLQPTTLELKGATPTDFSALIQQYLQKKQGQS